MAPAARQEARADGDSPRLRGIPWRGHRLPAGQFDREVRLPFPYPVIPSSGFAWKAVGYLQDGDASGTFSAVNPARTMETPVLDMVREPTTAYGASWSGEWWQADGSGTSAGLDYRNVKGESLEDFASDGLVFTRELVAGGDQDGLGAYIIRDQSLSSTLRGVAGARLDGWSDTAGHQDVGDLTTGGAASADRIPDASGTEFSPSLGLVWRPDPSLRLHANGQQSFSTPTLGDLYQPGGEGSIATESNPLLRTEHNTSFETGIDCTFQVEPGQEAHAPHSLSPGTAHARRNRVLQRPPRCDRPRRSRRKARNASRVRQSAQRLPG